VSAEGTKKNRGEILALFVLLTALAAACLLFATRLGHHLLSAVMLLGIAFLVVLVATLGLARLASKPTPSASRLACWNNVCAIIVVGLLGPVWVLPRIMHTRTFYIPAASMEPTLRIGDRLIASVEQSSTPIPRRGDLVIFEPPDNPSAALIKRVIGLPGDTLEIRDKQVFVGGKEVNEPWAVHRDPVTGGNNDFVVARRRRDQLSPIVVPPGHFFALGDNRDFSYDSRFFGPVPLSAIQSRPLYVYWASDLSRLGTYLGPS
jgi:signal peptidase I